MTGNTKIDFNKLPRVIQEDIRSYMRDNNLGELKQMTLRYALDMYLGWQGIQGYTYAILEIIKAGG